MHKFALHNLAWFKQYIKSNETNKKHRHRRTQIMKKTLGTMVAALAVVLLTGTFALAEYAAAGVANFPYFQLGCLIIGGMTVISLKHKYEKMYTGEVAGVFALYTVLIALFTNPVIEGIKNLVG
jgi:FtsH-binding integral membrane protein